MTRQRTRLRTAAVHRLLAGEEPDAAGVMPIDAHAQYAAVRCVVANPADVERVRAHLEATGSTTSTRARRKAAWPLLRLALPPCFRPRRPLMPRRSPLAPSA